MKENKWILEMELNVRDLHIFLESLDITSRLAAGEWNKLSDLFKENLDDEGKPMAQQSMKWQHKTELYAIRNKLMPWFEENGLGCNSHLGIYQMNLSPKAKTQYDIYKHIMYQRNSLLGIEDVYSTKPFDASKNAPFVSLIQLPERTNDIFWKLKIELDEEQLSCILQALDTSSRLSAGQWEQLQEIIYYNVNNDGRPMNHDFIMNQESLRQLCEIRNKIMPWFEKHHMRAYASIGIYSPHLSQRAKKRYDMYKHIMYQRNKELNIDNVYSNEPLDASEDGAPKLSLYRNNKKME